MSNTFNVGARIRTLRMLRGFSQEQLAEKAEITQTYLGMLERNVKNPTVLTIQKLCAALQIDLGSFFQSELAENQLPDPLVQQLADLLANRSPAEKQQILNLIENILTLRDL